MASRQRLKITLKRIFLCTVSAENRSETEPECPQAACFCFPFHSISHARPLNVCLPQKLLLDTNVAPTDTNTEKVSQKYLGGNHAVTITLRNSTMAARRAISARDSKIREELTRRSNRRPRGGGGGGGGERGGRPGQPKSNVGTGLLNHALSTAR